MRNDMTLYSDNIPIRQDLVDAINRAWARLGRPGTWLTGAERVAIAAEARAARSCGLCRWGKTADSAEMASDRHHESSRGLSAPLVDLVHRVATEASRLTEDDYLSALHGGLLDVEYVEMVGTVATIAGIDSFHRSLGLPVKDLPVPSPGDPLRRRPTRARSDGAWVPMVARQDLDPEDEDLYTKDRDGYVIRAMSLVPDEVRSLIDQSQNFYVRNLSDLAVGRSLSRPQIELIAARVSALNECFY